MGRAFRTAVATALCVAIAGCGGGGESRSQRPENVIVIVLDALRADRLGCYGHARDTSPAIDRLASDGVLFETAIAQCCFTPPAMASLMTGRHVPSHGLLGWEARLPETETTLAEVFRDAGYRTAGFVFLNLLTRQGLEQGFEQGAEMVEPADSVFLLGQSWIESAQGADRERPFFLLLHCYDVHRPYTPAAPYDTMFGDAAARGASMIDGSNETLAAIQEGRLAPTPADHARLADLYDGEVRYTDDRVAEFVRWLGEKKLLESTLLVVTADHGETLGERALLAAQPGAAPPLQYTHDESLFDPVMRIPLIFHGPGIAARGARVREQVRQIDIMPTILALVGMETPAGVEGASLLSADGAPLAGPPRVAFADAYPEPTRPTRYMRAVRLPHAKLIHDIHAGTWRMYDLAADPGEERDLRASAIASAGTGTNASGGAVATTHALFDSLASALFTHAESAGEVEEICLVWEGAENAGLAGTLSVTNGKILGVSHPPGAADTEFEIAPDGTTLNFRGGASSERSAIWVRVSSARVGVQLAVRGAAGGALPVRIYQREGIVRSDVSFQMAEIGHAYIDPFHQKTSGVSLFGRSRLEKQRIPISLDPEEIERLKALGYVGG
ncbi:MAG: sulfatase [bacterium]